MPAIGTLEKRVPSRLYSVTATVAAARTFEAVGPLQLIEIIHGLELELRIRPLNRVTHVFTAYRTFVPICILSNMRSHFNSLLEFFIRFVAR